MPTRKVIYAISLLVLIVSTYFTIKLFSNITPEFYSLLPRDSKVVQDINVADKRYPAKETIIIFVYPNDPNSGRRFVESLSKELSSDANRSKIKNVMYELREEIAFVKGHQPLYNELYDFQRLKQTLAKEKPGKRSYFEDMYMTLINWAKAVIYGPILNLPDGYISTNKSPSTMAMLIFPKGSVHGVAEAKELMKVITGAVKKVNRGFLQAPSVEYAGFAVEIIDEYSALMDDLMVSIAITIMLVVGLLLWFYRTWKLIVPLLYSLFFGTALCFGISYFVFGSLNYNTAFLCAIVIGNGINSGVIFLSYYISKYKENPDVRSATKYAWDNSFKPTLIASLASALTFASLIYSDLRGFREFGWIGLAGLLLCWAASYSVLPMMLGFNIFKLEKDYLDKYKTPLIDIFGNCLIFIKRYYKVTAITAIALCIGSIAYLAAQDQYGYLEKDTNKIRGKNSYQNKHLHYREQLIDIGLDGYFFPSFFILTNSQDDAETIKKKLSHNVSLKKVAPRLKFDSITSFIPKDQEEKIRLAEKIRTLSKANPKIAIPNSSQQELLKEINNIGKLEPITQDNLPPRIRELFQESDGRVGTVVTAAVDNQDFLDKNIVRNIFIMDRITKTADETLGKNNYHLFGLVPVLTEVMRIMLRDWLPIVLLSLLFVVAVLIAFYRDIKIISLSLISFIFSTSLFLALIPLLGTKINILSFIAIPITIGICVDYSANVIQVLHKDTFNKVAPFVLLASLTTIVGYISLLFVKQQSVFNFGLLCIRGELMALVGAFVLVPALFMLFFKKN